MLRFLLRQGWDLNSPGQQVLPTEQSPPQSRIILEAATFWPLLHCFIQKISAVLVVPPSAQHMMVFPNGEKMAGNMQECYRQIPRGLDRDSIQSPMLRLD